MDRAELIDPKSVVSDDRNIVPVLNETPYDSDFFDEQVVDALRSARLIVPLIMELLKPRSVVDVGCGLGAWLRTFSENGVTKVKGYDGEYVDRSKLLIDLEHFVATDLKSKQKIEESYDIALCVEVAEHLPESNASELVNLLTSAAPVVIFSAAVPGQHGTNHINEQWPSFWRSIFEGRGFQMLDPIRPRIRENKEIAWWYRQNLFVFASKQAVEECPRLRNLRKAQEVLDPSRRNVDIEWVHINVAFGLAAKASAFEAAFRESLHPGLRRLLSELPYASRTWLKRRFKMLRSSLKRHV
jgi:SAM-dependent methyltransferase